MRLKEKSIFVFSFLILFLVVFPSPAEGQLFPNHCRNIVPCKATECELCHLFVMLDRIIDCVLLTLIPLIAVFVMVITGMVFIFGYVIGDPEWITKGKQILLGMVMGLVLIYGAWLLVNTFFMLIGIADWTGLSGGWWEINCQ